MVNYTISEDCLHLIDSWKESKRNFSADLEHIQSLYPSYELWNRGIPQMCLEWAVHNFCYCIGFKRSQTKDCDLEYPQGFWVRAAYAVVGCLVWLFIK